MLKTSLNRYVKAVGAAQSLADAAVPLMEIGQAIGLVMPGVVDDFTANRIRMSVNGDFGEIFGRVSDKDRLSEPGYVREQCPVGRACRVAILPFSWQVKNIFNAAHPWDPQLEGFYRRTSEMGIVGGITVPVHMPMSRFGAVGWLAIDCEVDVDQVLATYSNELWLAAHLFMAHVYREGRQATALPPVLLSERELECLTWVAMGKTDADIAELIGRSPSTARFHVEKAVAKLGVNNRTRAAAVASQMGMIRAIA